MAVRASNFGLVVKESLSEKGGFLAIVTSGAKALRWDTRWLEELSELWYGELKGDGRG